MEIAPAISTPELNYKQAPFPEDAGKHRLTGVSGIGKII